LLDLFSLSEYDIAVPHFHQLPPPEVFKELVVADAFEVRT
jgi:hypothetical protein